mmetsp:Transcript_1581/g.5693  ORF Transcript_1581/g.5693 Transcript_1581/m.5693 type:complete len:265 (+) Transcript_1581:13-807(+)
MDIVLGVLRRREASPAVHASVPQESLQTVPVTVDGPNARSQYTWHCDVAWSAGGAASAAHSPEGPLRSDDILRGMRPCALRRLPRARIRPSSFARGAATLVHRALGGGLQQLRDDGVEVREVHDVDNVVGERRVEGARLRLDARVRVGVERHGADAFDDRLGERPEQSDGRVVPRADERRVGAERRARLRFRTRRRRVRRRRREEPLHIQLDAGGPISVRRRGELRDGLGHRPVAARVLGAGALGRVARVESRSEAIRQERNLL